MSRIGKFKVSGYIIKNLIDEIGFSDETKGIFKDVVITSVDYDYINDVFTYTAWSDKFINVDYGDLVPEYFVDIHSWHDGIEDKFDIEFKIKTQPKLT